MKTEKKPEKPSAEFERFRDFTKRILAVPKKEIEQQKAKYERQKTAKDKSR